MPDRLKVKNCFEAGDWGYVIEANILNPLRNVRFPERGNTVFKVDTGFSGPIMVTSDIFDFLGLADIEVPDDIQPVYRTLAGPVTMRSAPAVFQVNGKRLESDILTPLGAPSRMLVGFQVLEKLNMALLGAKACFVDWQT